MVPILGFPQVLFTKKEGEFPFWTHGFLVLQGFPLHVRHSWALQHQISSAALCLFVQKILRLRGKSRFGTAKRKSECVRESRVALSGGRCPGTQLLLNSSFLKWDVQWHSMHLSLKTFLSLQLETKLINPHWESHSSVPACQFLWFGHRLWVIFTQEGGWCFPAHRALAFTVPLMPMGCTATDKWFHSLRGSFCKMGRPFACGDA